MPHLVSDRLTIEYPGFRKLGRLAPATLLACVALLPLLASCAGTGAGAGRAQPADGAAPAAGAPRPTEATAPGADERPPHAERTERPAHAAGCDLARARVLDLTYAFGPDTLYWPTAATFARKDTFRGRTEAGFYYSAGDYAASEHGGTHLDAPVHFAAAGRPADRLPAERFIGPAWVLDARAACARDPDHLVGPADFAAQVKTSGEPPAGAILLLLTGWGRYWPARKAYLGDDRPGRTDALSFPGLDPELAQRLAARGVRAVGIDTASIDRGRSKLFESHQVLGAADIPVFENVACLDALPPTGAWVVAAPMKIQGGTGGPTRILGFVRGGAAKRALRVPPERHPEIAERVRRAAPAVCGVAAGTAGLVEVTLDPALLDDADDAAALEAEVERLLFRIRFELAEGKEAWKAPADGGR